MSSINSLLNHEPASGMSQARPDQQQEPYLAKTTLHEAADALTTLATLGSGQQYVPSRELPSPTAFNHAPRRTSSFGPHSPTLEQYHHGSKSPEEQRRQSLMLSSSPAPVLAPIQSLTSTLHDRINDEPPQTETSHGADVSQVVPPSRSSEDESGRDTTQDREPAFVRDEPTTSQIREPEAPTETESETIPHPINTDIPLPDATESLQSPVPLIKPEPTGTPREATPAILQTSERQNSVTGENLDMETRKAIEAVKQNELGLRAKKAPSITDSIASPTDTKPTPTNAKKRPAPASSGVKKKGTAAPKKPASKRRKLEPENSVEPGARSSTPTAKGPKSTRTKKGSHAGTPAAESSPAPDTSSQVHPSDDDDSSEDSTLYCICRKPDNHKWMIGCDGGCDDWFHGSCVNMVQADEDLVDKFICPNCETNGKGNTTWKPMCRREGCRKPARLEKGKMSKYCSDECGVLFFQEQLQRTAGAKKLPGKKSKKRGKENEQLSGDDDEPTPLGGVLRAKDLKALALASNNIEAFKRLGSGVLSPPQTASPTRASFDGKPNGITKPAEDLSLTPGEAGRLNALHTEKADLQVRLEVLKDREKFVSMAREQATRLAARENMKVKEFCGYDSRLSWSDAEFLRWRKCSTGQAAFKFGTLSPSAEQIASIEDTANGVKTEEEEKEVVCLKKRCPKHPQWQKLNLQDARFEEMEIVEAIKECEKQERSVRDRARRRLAKDTMAAELVGANGDVKQEQKNREGWVEVVEA